MSVLTAAEISMIKKKFNAADHRKPTDANGVGL